MRNSNKVMLCAGIHLNTGSKPPCTIPNKFWSWGLLWAVNTMQHALNSACKKQDYSQCQIIKGIEKYGISFLSDIHEKSNIKSFTMPHITDCNFIPFIHLSIHLSVRYIASSTLGPVMVVFTTSSRAIMISAPILFCTFYDRNTIAQENWSIRYFKLVI